MSGAGACPVYLERWTLVDEKPFASIPFNAFLAQLLAAHGIEIASATECSVYLHHFIGDDWAIDPHDHPRQFISIGLAGWYYEDVFGPDGALLATERFDAPWVRTFPAEHLHRVRAAECGDCWTLVIVLPKSRRWGFVREGEWVPFKDYVFEGKSRKAC